MKPGLRAKKNDEVNPMIELEQLNIEEIINSVSTKLSRLKTRNKIEEPALIGIRRGGVWIGKKISEQCFPGEALEN